MPAERRRSPRHALYLDCTWDGASGLSTIRISDLSVTGCFVDSRATPPVGHRIGVHVTLGTVPATLYGTVVSTQREIGFAVQFEELDPATRERLLGLLTVARGESHDGE